MSLRLKSLAFLATILSLAFANTVFANRCIDHINLLVKNQQIDFPSSCHLSTDDIHSALSYLDMHPDITGATFREATLDQNNLYRLATNQTLKFLRIDTGEVDDKGAELLAKNVTLSELYLFDNKITDRGAQYLAKNNHLLALTLINKGLSDQTAYALSQNHILKRLDIRNNHFSADALLQLAKNMNLTSIKLSGNETAKASGVSFVVNPNLKEFELDSKQDAHFYYFLGKLSHIETLDIHDFSLTEANLVALANNKHISSLSIFIDKMTDAGANAIASLPNLKKLSLVVSDAQMSDQALKAIASLPKLQELEIETSLAWNVKVIPMGIETAHALANNATLKTLSITGYKLSDDVLLAINETHSIQNLYLAHNQAFAEKTLIALVHNPSYKNLGLELGVTFLISRDVGIALMTNTTLEVLGLSVPNFSDDGIIWFVQNKTLKQLYIDGFYLGGPFDGDFFASTLSQFNRSITTLWLRQCHISNQALRVLAANPALQELNLTGNNIDSEGAKIFDKNATLAVLTLERGKWD